MGETKDKKEIIEKEPMTEADPIEENVIIPIIHPITVKDVVDNNEDPVRNSNTTNKGSDRAHYRKRMVETFILKKPKESIQTIDTSRAINHTESKTVSVEATKHQIDSSTSSDLT